MVKNLSKKGARVHDEHFSLAVTGDLLFCRRWSIYDEEAFLSLIKILRDADVTFGNAETTIGTGGDYAYSAHFVVLSPPYIADELKWAGYDLINCAMNHAGDYGLGGILSTIKELDRVGLTHAGSGSNLAEARAPSYLETKKGRVALMGVTTSAREGFRAIEARIDERGRPGVNGIRMFLSVDKETVEKLKKTFPNLVGSRDEQTTFLGTQFLSGDKMEYVMDQRDYEANIKWVKHSKRMADWMFISLHWHQRSFEGREIVPRFVEKFAKGSIDAGADAFLGHGPHDIRGVEIYKDKPILYSVGNFFGEHETTEPQPTSVYETITPELNPIHEATSADIVDRYGADTLKTGLKAHAVGEREDQYWETVVAVATFNQKDKKLADLKFYPVWLQKDQSVSQRGRPILADLERGKKIIEKLKRLSEPYGTKIEYIAEKNMGITKL